MKKVSTVLGAILVVLLLASPSFGTLITINNLDGYWQNAVPAANATIVNGAPTSIAFWGGSITTGSNYTFTSEVPPPVIADVPPSPSSWFDLGDFYHNNFPIPGGTSITEIELLLDIAMTVDTAAVNRSFVYTFYHNETPNPAPDEVTISAPSAGSFLVDGTLYTLELRFSEDGGQTLSDQFITAEGSSNRADLFGRFTSEDVPAVPEPATMLLLCSGLVGLVGLRRKFRR